VYAGFDAADTPSDPLYGRARPYLDAVHAPQAWEIETGRPEIIVAVLDTGIDAGHPDLQGRIWTNAAEVPGNGSDDDANGCIDDVHGCAFVDFAAGDCENALEGDVADDIGHGTFVSGIIAANGNNGAGIVGVARNVTVLPVKVLDCGGRGLSLSLARGIDYAVAAGARVINISLGGPFHAIVIQEAVAAAAQAGALVVGASGNSGDGNVVYPARYPEVLAVGASSFRDPDRRASFSTYGPEVDVVAVGERILGTVPADSCGVFLSCVGGAYASGNGTSFAAPQVAGLVALMLSRRPALTPAGVIDIVRATAQPLPAGGEPDWAGAGRVHMAEALRPAFRVGVPGVSKH
jgi:subtilisin family serine protease